ncbi:hypothetical protein MUO71_04355 [Candidatus Bathyarchaeota archaeon]|nr:hypothetical protein [Candidatus Bathyarchaeota archaeon]
MPQIRRKTFAAREDLIERASEVAKKKGFSFYAFVNEILQLTLQAEEMGISIRSLIEEHRLLKAAKEASFILGLETLWYEMTDIACENAKRKAVNSWVEAGAWLAKRYVSSGTKDPFLAFKSDLEAFTWNASELDVEEKKDEVSIRIISPKFSESYTFLLAAFLESALETFGYTRFNKDVTRGTIRMKAHRRKD